MKAHRTPNYTGLGVWRRWMQDASARVIFTVIAAGVLTITLTSAPVAQASGPNSNVTKSQHSVTTNQDPQWLAAKLDYRVVAINTQGKGGANIRPTIVAAPVIDLAAQKSAKLVPGTQVPLVSGAPTSYTLPYSGTGAQYAAEPGDGAHGTNFPNYSGDRLDDYGTTVWSGHSYYDPYYVTLCGPGAADVALFFWPSPPNYGNYSNVVDPLVIPNSSTTWKGQDNDGTYRMRGYLLHIAFQIHPPTWYKIGMLPQSTYQSGELGGATLQAMNDGMNWEASGENLSDWSSYFYVVQWNSAYYNQRTYPGNLYTALHNDIVTDIGISQRPMTVEVNASYLPNWGSGANVNHFVTIIGYNDSTGQYGYIDTCKFYTGCDTGTHESQGDSPDLHWVSQSTLAAGVANIGTNQTTGDGGWIW